MKKLSLFILLIVGASMMAQPPKGKAKPGTVYGAAVSRDNVKSVADLSNSMKSSDTVAMKVKVHVEDVCSAKGCWFTFKMPDGQNAMVKMKDYGFFVPTDLKGKDAIVDGKAFIKVTSVDDLKHYAEDAKKSQAEIDAIKEPKQEVRFLASGVLVD